MDNNEDQIIKIPELIPQDLQTSSEKMLFIFLQIEKLGLTCGEAKFLLQNCIDCLDKLCVLKIDPQQAQWFLQ